MSTKVRVLVSNALAKSSLTCPKTRGAGTPEVSPTSVPDQLECSTKHVDEGGPGDCKAEVESPGTKGVIGAQIKPVFSYCRVMG